MLNYPTIKDKTPTVYSGLMPNSVGFEEEFEKLSDQKKLELVYYIEREAMRSGGKVGIIIGALAGFIIAAIYFYSRLNF